MKVVVFGANGKVGRIVVSELLKRGHAVTAFVRGEYYFPKDKKLRIIEGDAYDPFSVMSAIKDNDAVVSALGSWGTKHKNVLTEGMRNIIPAMRKHGATRIVSLTGADCRAPDDKPSFVHNLIHALLSMLATKILKDGEAHLDQLIASNLDWTVIRSPVMNESGNPDLYKLSYTRPRLWRTIHRYSVAYAMADSLESKDHIKQAPFITRT